ncbi:MAG: FtsX-like permease family protein [Gemmatimonadetes bacterium]|nr:FtsX-like permease family protein [Gemmatimonadota bacterium]
MIQDVRYALRQLARHPVFTAIAVLTLALGIGANTAIFSAARAALLQPLPFEHEDRLVRLYLTSEAGGPLISLRPEVFLAVQQHGRFFDRIVAQRFTSFALTTEAGPERVVGIAVSQGWNETLGVRPIIGRPFTPEEEAAGEDAGVVLISHGAWQRRFGGSPDVLGEVILLDGRPHSVVGVMPPGFRYPYEAELWVPLRVSGEQRGVWSFNAPARLKPGWTVEQARADLRALATAVAPQVPDLRPGTTLTAVPIRETLVEDEGRTLVVLLAAVGFLLLIVCANLANLLLSRALGREREFALRSAIGAARTRLLRQVLVESVVLATLGGAAGLAVAYAGSALVQPLLPSDLSYFGTTAGIDATVLAFVAIVSVACGLLFGLLPALRLSHERPFSALGSTRGGIGRGRGGRRLERALVVGELALALTLLTGIGLLLRDFQRLHSADLGYDPAGLLTYIVSLPPEEYATAESRSAFVGDAIREVERIPGVTAAGVTTMFPSARGNSVAEVQVEGREFAPGERHQVNTRMVTPGFLEAMGIPLLRGRTISEADRADASSVVVVSASLARRYWPDEDPIGKRVRNSRGGEDAPWMTIVGVVGDVREFYDVEETWYVPYAQHAETFLASRAVFVLRSATSSAPAIPVVRQAMNTVDPGLPIFDAITAEDLYASSLSRQSQAAMLGTVFAAFALLLATLGIYGTMSYAVNRRVREFGVRMALGGERRTILMRVAAEGGRLVLLGMAIGLAGALVLARFLASALTEVGPFDVTAFAVAAAVLTAATLGAALLPALRATRIDPAEALRHL